MSDARTPLKNALDASALFAFAATCFSGVVLRSALPKVAQELGMIASPYERNLLGFTNGEWAAINNAAVVLFLFLLLPNLYWGWGVLAKIVKKGDGSGSAPRAALGVIAALTLLIGAFNGFAVSGPAAVVSPVFDSVPLLGPDSDAILLGLSLEEAGRKTAVPVEHFRKTLKLPADVPTDVPFSELAAKYKFTMDEVRNAVLSHRIGRTFKVPINNLN